MVRNFNTWGSQYIFSNNFFNNKIYWFLTIEIFRTREELDNLVNLPNKNIDQESGIGLSLQFYAMQD